MTQIQEHASWEPHLAAIAAKFEPSFGPCRAKVSVEIDSNAATEEPVRLLIVGPEGDNAVKWQTGPIPGITTIEAWLQWLASAPTA